MTKKELYTKAFSWKNKMLKKKGPEGETLKSRLGFPMTRTDMVAKYLTSVFGSVWFLNLAAVVIFGWILINLGLVPGIAVVDPYPFTSLMLFAQLATIFLSITVLISQHRQGRMTEVRQQIDFEINVRAEHEITKILQMLDEIHIELGIQKRDKELDQMKEKTDISEIKEQIEHIIEEEKKLQ